MHVRGVRVKQRGLNRDLFLQQHDLFKDGMDQTNSLCACRWKVLLWDVRAFGYGVSVCGIFGPVFTAEYCGVGVTSVHGCVSNQLAERRHWYFPTSSASCVGGERSNFLRPRFLSPTPPSRTAGGAYT